MNAKEILIYLIETLLMYVKELSCMCLDPFTYGEKTAFIECLEILQRWEESAMYGLDIDLISMYPI